MANQILEPVSRSWTTRRDEKRRRIEQVKPWMKGSILPKEKILEALESLIVEAAAFHDGIVIVQVNQIVDKLPRVDIPASWIDVVVEADKPFGIEPLFTRDPRHIDELQILIGMMVIRGIYEKHQVHSLNHGIGFDTAAIELLLPTYV